MKRRKRRKRTGISLLLLAIAFLLPAEAAKKKAAALEPYVLLAGTVFRETGFSLANAEIVVTPDPTPDTPPAKIKKMQTVSDARGEFALRLPTASMRYTVRVSARGYRSEEKSVTVQNEDRVDVTFQLHDESK